MLVLPIIALLLMKNENKFAFLLAMYYICNHHPIFGDKLTNTKRK